jgi:tetratricopeptide (TPR) repeat protein
MTKMRIRLLCSSILTIGLCHFIGVAQVQTSPQPATVEIHGQVRLVDGGAPAANVLVRLESYDGGGSISEAFTDRLGKFRFTALSPAMYSVRVHQPGYRDAEQNVDMTTQTSGLVLLQIARDASSNSSASGMGTINAQVPAAAQKEFDKGVAALSEGGKEKTTFATHCFEKAISLAPQFVEARLKLGTAYMDLGEWDKAEKALSATVAEEPRAFNALFALGEVYLRENKLAEAESSIVKGLAIQSQSDLGHFNLARVYWEKARGVKDVAEARPALEKSYEEVKHALTLNPNLGGAHLLKGNLLLRATRAADAINEFDEYLRLEPNGAFATETRALVERIRKASASAH